MNTVITKETDFEQCYTEFKQKVENVMDILAPEVTVKLSNKNDPKWFDQEFKKARALRRKLERKWRKSRSIEDHNRYIEQRNLCAKLSLTKQESYYSSIIESSSNKQKSLFKVVNEVLDKKEDRILPAHNDPIKLANKFNLYYIDKIDKLRESIPPSDDNQVHVQNPFNGIKLDNFSPTTAEEVRQIIKEYGVKTSSEDPLPASLIKSTLDELIPIYVHLVNKSLADGTMNGIKHSEISPLLKKQGLDADTLKNYRPVNNLVFLSKLIERIVQKRIEYHMESNNLHTKEFFGYKRFHSTETMMLGITEEILSGFDDGKCTIMLFMDLSAAFDTIDIEKLIAILGEEIGLSGTALKWCKSFLSERTQRVKIKGEYSESIKLKYGTVQGSVLGPPFFNIYIRSQPKVFHNNGFRSTAFADDSNGRKTFSITFQYSVLRNEVPLCVQNVTSWMNQQYMKVNPDKTEIILFFPKSLKDQVVIKGTIIGEDCIRFSKEVKNVGVWLDENLLMDKHVNSIIAHSYKLLKNIGRIRNILTNKYTETLVHAVISRLDYCNSLFVNISKRNIFKLQKVQNAAARLVVRGKKNCSITSVLNELHWLKIEERIVFKVLLLVFKCLNGLCSNNLETLLRKLPNQCRSQNMSLLETRWANTKYGKRTFSYAGPKLWNMLPANIQGLRDVDRFKKNINTILFKDTQQISRHISS